MTIDEAQNAIRCGARYGDVFPSLDEQDQSELKEWFLFEFKEWKRPPDYKTQPKLKMLAASVNASVNGVHPAPKPIDSVGPIASAKMAREWGYTGDICTTCQSLMVRSNGSCKKCDACGTTTGCS